MFFILANWEWAPTCEFSPLWQVKSKLMQLMWVLCALFCFFAAQVTAAKLVQVHSLQGGRFKMGRQSTSSKAHTQTLAGRGEGVVLLGGSGIYQWSFSRIYVPLGFPGWSHLNFLFQWTLGWGKTESQGARCPLMHTLCRLVVKNTRRTILMSGLGFPSSPRSALNGGRYNV